MLSNFDISYSNVPFRKCLPRRHIAKTPRRARTFWSVVEF